MKREEEWRETETHHCEMEAEEKGEGCSGKMQW